MRFSPIDQVIHEETLGILFVKGLWKLVKYNDHCWKCRKKWSSLGTFTENATSSVSEPTKSCMMGYSSFTKSAKAYIYLLSISFCTHCTFPYNIVIGKLFRRTQFWEGSVLIKCLKVSAMVHFSFDRWRTYTQMIFECLSCLEFPLIFFFMK